MKSYTTLLFGLLFSAALWSQNTPPPQDLSFGFTFAPSAITTFGDSEQPFETAAPLYLAGAYARGKVAYIPFYNFGANSAGLFLTYTFNDKFGSYLVIDQSLTSNNGVYGLGLTTPLFENYVQGFVEIGSSYGDDQQPALLIGMYMNFYRSVKTW